MKRAEKISMVGELSEVENKVSDKAHQREFQRAVKNAESMAGTRFDDVKVHSIATMGEAAGWFKPGTEEMAVREDLVATRDNCRNLLSRVLVHEELHNKGMEMEGMTEYFAIEKHHERGLNTKMLTYENQVKAAGKIVDLLGKKQTEELALGANAENKLIDALVNKEIQRERRGIFTLLSGGRGRVEGKVKEIRERAMDLVRKAA